MIMEFLQLLGHCFPQLSVKQVRVLMLGLDSAGKTTVLYRLKDQYVPVTQPTIGFHVDTIRHKRVDYNLWDIGGQKKLRLLWRNFFLATQGLIFVVDSADTSRLAEAHDELHSIARARVLKDVAVLVMANKQDLDNAWSPGRLRDYLDLWTLPQKKWHVQSTIASTGCGLYEGLEWLAANSPE